MPSKSSKGPSKAESPGSAVVLLSASLRDFLARVERYIVRDPETKRITGIRLAADELNDPRAFHAMCAAAPFLKANVVHDRMTYEDAGLLLRSRRELYRMWAQEALTDAGFPAPDDRTLLDLSKRTDLSALRFAAQIEFGCRRLEVSTDATEKAFLPEHIATLIATMSRLAQEEHLKPYAERGAKALQSTRNAGKAKAEEARKKSRAIAWREEVEGRRSGSAEAVYGRIERREGLQPGTVKKAILRLRKRTLPR